MQKLVFEKKSKKICGWVVVGVRRNHFYLLGKQLHHELWRCGVGTQRRAEHMGGSMTETLMATIGAVRTERGRQCFAINANAIVPSSGTGQLNASLLAHHMHHIKWTIYLRTI